MKCNEAVRVAKTKKQIKARYIPVLEVEVAKAEVWDLGGEEEPTSRRKRAKNPKIADIYRRR